MKIWVGSSVAVLLDFLLRGEQSESENEDAGCGKGCKGIFLQIEEHGEYRNPNLQFWVLGDTVLNISGRYFCVEKGRKIKYGKDKYVCKINAKLRRTKYGHESLNMVQYILLY